MKLLQYPSSFFLSSVLNYIQQLSNRPIDRLLLCVRRLFITHKYPFKIDKLNRVCLYHISLSWFHSYDHEPISVLTVIIVFLTLPYCLLPSRVLLLSPLALLTRQSSLLTTRNNAMLVLSSWTHVDQHREAMVQHKTFLTLSTLLSSVFSLPPNSTDKSSANKGSPHLAVDHCSVAGKKLMCCPNGSPHGSKYFFDPDNGCAPVSRKCTAENTFCCGQYRSGFAGTYYNNICHQAEVGSTKHSYNATDPDDLIEAMYLFEVENCQEV